MDENMGKEYFTQNYIIGADGELFRMPEFDLASTSLLSSSSSRSLGVVLLADFVILKIRLEAELILQVPLEPLICYFPRLCFWTNVFFSLVS